MSAFLISFKSVSHSHGVLVSISVAVKICYDHGNFYKGKHFIGTELQFHMFSPLSLGRKYGDIQADMVLER